MNHAGTESPIGAPPPKSRFVWRDEWTGAAVSVNGGLVEIDHGGGIVTAYGHLSGFAAIARPGAHVDQGQTIGFVGMTGLATGPHLHYEYRVNGQFLDPQRIKLPDTRPIDDTLMPGFLQQTAPLLAPLQAAAPAAVAAR